MEELHARVQLDMEYEGVKAGQVRGRREGKPKDGSIETGILHQPFAFDLVAGVDRIRMDRIGRAARGWQMLAVAVYADGGSEEDLARPRGSLHGGYQVPGPLHIVIPGPLRLPLASQDIDDEGQVEHHLAVHYRSLEIFKAPYISPGGLDPIPEPVGFLTVLLRFEVETPYLMTQIEEALDRPSPKVPKCPRQ